MGALLSLSAWPALPVGTQEGAECNARLISPSPRPCRHEVRAGDVMRVGGRRETVEGSGRGQGLLTKLQLLFQGMGGRPSRLLRDPDQLPGLGAVKGSCHQGVAGVRRTGTYETA